MLELLQFYFTQSELFLCVPGAEAAGAGEVASEGARWDRWGLGSACHYCQALTGFHDHRNLTGGSATENDFHWVGQSHQTGFLGNLQGSSLKLHSGWRGRQTVPVYRGSSFLCKAEYQLAPR